MRSGVSGSTGVFIELDDLVKSYCQKPDHVPWNEHLGPAYKLLTGPSRSLVRTVEVAAISVMSIAVMLCIVYFGTGNAALAWGSGAAVLVFGALLEWHQRSSPRPRQIVELSGERSTYAGLFLRLHDHLKSGALIAYQRPHPAGAGGYRPVSLNYWRASYGWLGMLGEASRSYGIGRIEHPLYVSRSSVEAGSLAAELWLSEAAAKPKSIAYWPNEKLEALQGLLVQLIGPDSTVSSAFEVFRRFKEELSKEGARTPAIAAVVINSSPDVTDHRRHTADNLVNGRSVSFNKRLMKASHLLGQTA